MNTLMINLATPYPIHINVDFDQYHLLIDFVQKLGNTTIIIADVNLQKHAENILHHLQVAKINSHLILFTGGEQNKTRKTKEYLEDQLLAMGCGRDTCLIAVGGGITTDVVGFIAATYNRGIPVVYLPTSLLAMVDASIGGKTGVNTPFGKNLIGSFYQPQAVFIELKVLATLPPNEFCNGMAEVIKHAVIRDKALFTFLEKNCTNLKKLDNTALTEIITRSNLIKKELVELDEKDLGVRQLLNFGHTIGHALELVTDYQISHGYAVALGMLAEAHISVQLGLFSPTNLAKLKNLIINYNLWIPHPNINLNKLKKALALDKKARFHQPHFVLLEDIGQTHLSETGHVKAIAENLIDASLLFLT